MFGDVILCPQTLAFATTFSPSAHQKLVPAQQAPTFAMCTDGGHVRFRLEPWETADLLFKHTHVHASHGKLLRPQTISNNKPGHHVCANLSEQPFLKFQTFRQANFSTRISDRYNLFLPSSCRICNWRALVELWSSHTQTFAHLEFGFNNHSVTEWNCPFSYV